MLSCLVEFSSYKAAAGYYLVLIIRSNFKIANALASYIQSRYEKILDIYKNVFICYTIYWYFAIVY